MREQFLVGGTDKVLADATVKANGQLLPAINSNYQLKGLRDSIYHIEINHPGYQPVSFNYKVKFTSHPYLQVNIQMGRTGAGYIYNTTGGVGAIYPDSFRIAVAGDPAKLMKDSLLNRLADSLGLNLSLIGNPSGRAFWVTYRHYGILLSKKDGKAFLPKHDPFISWLSRKGFRVGVLPYDGNPMMAWDQRLLMLKKLPETSAGQLKRLLEKERLHVIRSTDPVVVAVPEGMGIELFPLTNRLYESGLFEYVQPDGYSSINSNP